MSDPQSPAEQRKSVPHTLGAGIMRLLSLCNNPLSMIGLLMVVSSLIAFITMLLMSSFGQHHNPYLDVFTYLILPSILVFGLVFVPIGGTWKRIWLLRHGTSHIPRYVQFDLHDHTTQGALIVFLAGTLFIILPCVGVSAYEGYIYTESTEFCAEVCHTVMEPQGTAHATSPHARVSCAECHIGSGAGWFVKSKLSGSRQVLAVWSDSFSRPIPPAITELRPARETCEECHWPDKFYGYQYKERAHYSPDEQNTRRVLRMMLHTGGADESIGRVEGIHMHMLVVGSVEYVATDDHLQEIPWVRYHHSDGTTTIYRSDGRPIDAQPPQGVVRTVDCMDCHNRGAHHFTPPQSAVDLSLEAGRIDQKLPYIKREAVKALTANYTTLEAGISGIEKDLQSFYQANYPKMLETQADSVKRAIAAVQQIYKRTFFPAMKVDWRTYPENIGHMRSAGCFRCHDGLHINKEGKAITSDCTVCHTFLNQVPGHPDEFKEGTFEHAMSFLHHENLRCEQCHTGGELRLCRDCHKSLAGLNQWDEQGRLRRLTLDGKEYDEADKTRETDNAPQQ